MQSLPHLVLLRRHDGFGVAMLRAAAQADRKSIATLIGGNDLRQRRGAGLYGPEIQSCGKRRTACIQTRPRHRVRGHRSRHCHRTRKRMGGRFFSCRGDPRHCGHRLRPQPVPGCRSLANAHLTLNPIRNFLLHACGDILETNSGFLPRRAQPDNFPGEFRVQSGAAKPQAEE